MNKNIWNILGRNIGGWDLVWKVLLELFFIYKIILSIHAGLVSIRHLLGKHTIIKLFNLPFKLVLTVRRNMFIMLS